MAGAAEHAESGERPVRLVELSGRVEAFLLECESLLSELAGLACERGALGWVGSGRGGVEGERLCRGAGERVGEPVDRTVGLGAVGRRVGLELGGGRVEAGLLARAGEGDVAPFAERAAVVGEHERALEREPLGLVAGERVGVATWPASR